MATTDSQTIVAPTAITVKRWAISSASRPAVTSADCGPPHPAIAVISERRSGTYVRVIQLGRLSYASNRITRFSVDFPRLQAEPSQKSRHFSCLADPMVQTAADILIEVLQEWGVDTVFGL